MKKKEATTDTKKMKETRQESISIRAITVRIPSDALERFKEIAKAENRSFAGHLAYIIKRNISEYTASKGLT